MLSLADHDLIARDTALPGLRTLLDPHEFSASLIAALPALERAQAQINYLRYKPGANCLARFRLDLDGQSIQGYAKAYGSDVSEKFAKARERQTVSTAAGPGRLLLDDCGIEVVFFPNDSKLKALTTIMDVAGREALLRKRVSGRPDLWQAELVQLNYKPERRFVARLDVDGVPTAVLKHYAKREFERARNAPGAVVPGRTLQLPGQLGASRHRHVIVLDWLRGTPLQQIISQPEVDRPAVRRVGAALAELHNQTGAGLETQTPLAIRESIRSATGGISVTSPGLEPLVSELEQRIGQLLAGEQTEPVTIHGDFYADQVLAGDDRASIVDLDNVVRGNPASDLGLFIAHLERNALTEGRPKAPVAPVRDALLEGYQSVRPLPSRDRINLHTAVGLMQLAPHHFRNREPGWDQRTSVTLHRALELIDSLPGRYAVSSTLTGASR